MDIKELRRKIIQDPLSHVPAWTVAALDPTVGELPRRQTDREGMEKYLKALEGAGAPGILLAASTGWGHVRNFEEHRETLLTGGEIRLEHSVKQALLRMEDPLDKNIELLKELEGLDYGIAWTRRGSLLPPDAGDEEVARGMLPLVGSAAELGLPVGIYSISTVDGAALTPEAAEILLELLGKELANNVVAVKITEPDFLQSTQAFINSDTFRTKKIVQGWDSHYEKALKAGLRADGIQQCGATSGAAACMVFAFKAMVEAGSRQDWPALSDVQEAVSRVFFSMQGEDKNLFPDLQIAKWVMGLGHPLTEERSVQDTEKLFKTIGDLSEHVSPASVKLILDSLLLMRHSAGYESPVTQQLQKLYP